MKSGSTFIILSEALNRKKNIWKRLGEIFIEMLIIVFAVSLAVSLERRREYHNEQKEVKEFLTGLRFDLENDITEMKEDSGSYVMQSKWFKYFAFGGHYALFT
jgi:benzoyl-CoA reductase/2-hydroxyglutaryl-CoA dehydratase subunit BcrC/BadD/HgdB